MPIYTTNNSKNQSVLLQTILFNISNPLTNKTIKVRALLDLGSQFSYISQNISNKLNLEILDSKQFSISTFGNVDSKICNSDLVEISIDNDLNKLNLQVYTTPFLCQPLEGVKFSDRDLAEFQLLPLADPEILLNVNLPIDLLIGSNNYWHIIKSSNILNTAAGPTGVWTVFGYVMSGPFTSDSVSVQSDSITSSFLINNTFSDSFSCDEEKKCDVILERFWSLESMAIFPENDKNLVLEVFNKTIKFLPEENRYCVSLPWKTNLFHKLNDNKGLALKRLDSVLKKLNKEGFEDGGFSGSEIISEIDTIFKKQLELGVIEKVNNPDVVVTNNDCHTSINSGAIHYLPIRYVLKDEAVTTKLRICFDASAKPNNRMSSLNDTLFSGPPLHTDMAGILLRWRLFPIAICSDISKAFLQIILAEIDRDVTRFLWKPGGDLNAEPVVFRSTRVIFGLRSSPFLLNTVIATHLKRNASNYPCVYELNLEHSFM